MANKSTSSEMSYETKMIIVILLFLFIYPAGVILMWVWMKWPRWIKILLTIIPFLFLFLIFGFVLSILTIVFSNKDIQNQLRQQLKSNTQVEISQTPNQPEIDTTTWKTYTNKSLGLSFQYPGGAWRTDPKNEFDPKAPTGQGAYQYYNEIIVSKTTKVKSNTTKEYVDSILNEKNITDPTQKQPISLLDDKQLHISTQEVDIDGYKGITIYGLPGLQDYIPTYILKDNSLYEFSVVTSHLKDTDFIPTYNKILSTFKFTQ